MLLLETGLIGHTFFSHTTAQYLNISEGQLNSPVSHFIHQKQHFKSFPAPAFILTLEREMALSGLFFSGNYSGRLSRQIWQQANFPNCALNPIKLSFDIMPHRLLGSSPEQNNYHNKLLKKAFMFRLHKVQLILTKIWVTKHMTHYTYNKNKLLQFQRLQLRELLMLFSVFTDFWLAVWFQIHIQVYCCYVRPTMCNTYDHPTAFLLQQLQGALLKTIFQ